MAVSRDDPPRYRKKIADTDLVPVLLDLSTAEDVQLRIDRVPASQRLLSKAIRLCQQAHAQGGLLSNCDLAELLNTHDSQIAHVLSRHESLTNTIVPGRATLHDVGTGLTHKRIICWKRYAQGKEPHVVARETYHSPEAVDRYLGQYDRVRHCRVEGLTPAQTAYMPTARSSPGCISSSMADSGIATPDPCSRSRLGCPAAPFPVPNRGDVSFRISVLSATIPHGWNGLVCWAPKCFGGQG
jgi:uncharacterized protein DUF1670